MQSFTVHAAKTHLSRLIEAALAGEDVVIARGSTPVIRLVPVIKQSLRIGILANQVGTAPDFIAAMDETELALWEGHD